MIRILVLGGTRFIGPAVVHHLYTMGHAVTLFHRGQSRIDNLPDLPRLLLLILLQSPTPRQAIRARPTGTPARRRHLPRGDPLPRPRSQQLIRRCRRRTPIPNPISVRSSTRTGLSGLEECFQGSEFGLEVC